MTSIIHIRLLSIAVIVSTVSACSIVEPELNEFSYPEALDLKVAAVQVAKETLPVPDSVNVYAYVVGDISCSEDRMCVAPDGIFIADQPDQEPEEGLFLQTDPRMFERGIPYIFSISVSERNGSGRRDFDLLGVSLADETELTGAPPFRTDRNHYFAVIDSSWKPAVTFDIPTAFTNVTDKTVYLIGCMHPSRPVLEKRTDEGWVVAYASVEKLCLSPPWAVRPSETYRDTFYVRGYFPGHKVHPTFNTEIDGTYRLTRRVYADREGNRLISAHLRVSNTFSVERR